MQKYQAWKTDADLLFTILAKNGGKQMNVEEFRRTLTPGSLQAEYFHLLSDQASHCRKCAQLAIGSEQLAGGGGVQGLQRGTKNRPGLVIETTSKYCEMRQKNEMGSVDR